MLSLQEFLFSAQLGSAWLGPAAIRERELNWPQPEPSQKRQACQDAGDHLRLESNSTWTKLLSDCCFHEQNSLKRFSFIVEVISL